MSSIRLFILDSFARHGEMHGHQLRLQAEQEHVHHWTDVSVGSLYGAIKRLATEGLLEIARTERDGNFPERHVYAITDAGRETLARVRQDGLDKVVFRPDPFDLALTRPDIDHIDELGDTIEARRAALQSMLDEAVTELTRAAPYLSVAETHAMLHRQHRLRAELSWHDSLLESLPAIVADEKAGARHAEAASRVTPTRSS